MSVTYDGTYSNHRTSECQSWQGSEIESTLRDRYKHNIAWLTSTTPHLKHMPVAILTMYSPHVVECVLGYLTLSVGY
jgi:hypothetical protein